MMRRVTSCLPNLIVGKSGFGASAAVIRGAALASTAAPVVSVAVFRRNCRRVVFGIMSLTKIGWLAKHVFRHLAKIARSFQVAPVVPTILCAGKASRLRTLLKRSKARLHLTEHPN